MTKKSDAPAIRFKGFSDAWEQRKVSELFRVTRGYVLAATQTETTKTDEKPYPVYSSQTKDKGLMGYYKDYLYEDAITWTTDGANAGTVNYRAGKFYCTNVCGVLLSNEVKANQMIAEALNSVAKGYVSYVGNPKLMNNVMADIVIQIPTQAEEREQLSSFFAKLDNLITLHQRKFEKLTNVKKSMLEKMFPQNGSSYPEIRFKGFTDPWEQRKLGDIASDMVAGGDIDKDLILAEGQYPVIANALTGDGIVGYYDKEYRVNAPAVTVTGRGDVGHAKARLVNFTPVVRLLSVKSEHDVFFLENAINTLKIVIESTGVPQLTVPQLAKYEVAFPRQLDEEEHIGAFFKQLDNLITLHQRELEKLQNIKKSMLEKMFV